MIGVCKKNVRLWPGIFCFFLFTGGFLFSQTPVLFQSEIQTRWTREEGYITYGAVLLGVDPEVVVGSLSTISLLEEWFIGGMGEDAARNNNLKVALTRIEGYPASTDTCRIDFSLLLTKRWLIRNRSLDVSIEVFPESGGWINRIRYNIPMGGLFIKESGYDIYILDIGMGRSLVIYDFTVHLAGVAELLFNEDFYRRNIEWYINRILNNCIDFLQD